MSVKNTEFLKNGNIAKPSKSKLIQIDSSNNYDEVACAEFQEEDHISE